ncbi:MAG TPA: hypothetical protein V6D33_18125 [Cyanophyceae cyanobacterium]
MPNQQAKSLEAKVDGFVTCTQRRNIRETVGACVVITIFALDVAYRIYRQNQDPFSIIGSGVTILTMLLNIIIIWRKLHIPKSELSAFPPTQFPEKWKHHLTYQARMLRSSWLWFLLPLFLGLCLYLPSAYDAYFIVPLLIVGAVYVGVWRLNLKAAERLERDRDTWFSNSRVSPPS